MSDSKGYIANGLALDNNLKINIGLFNRLVVKISWVP